MTKKNTKQAKPTKSVFNLVILFLAVAVLAGGGWWFFDARRQARQRTQAANSLHNIGLALHEYHDTHRHFPPASVVIDGKPGLSWRVYILPYVEGASLFHKFNLDEPWDSEHNIQLVDQMPRVFENPGFDLAPGKTCFVAPNGPDTIWKNVSDLKDKDAHLSMRDIVDPTHDVGAVVEVPPDMAVIWTKPDDIDLNDPRLRASRPGMMQAVNADASIRVMPNADITPVKLEEYFNRHDGKRGVSDDKPR